MNAEIFAASDELIAAVFNGVYQGIIVTLLVYLVLRLIGPINAATRYWIWGSTLLLVMALIPAHYCRNRFFPYLSRLTIISQEPKPVLDTAPARLPEASVLVAADLDQTTTMDPDLSFLPDSDTLAEVNPDPTICLDDPSAATTDPGVLTPLLASNDLSESPVTIAGPSPGAATRSMADIVSVPEAEPGWHGWNMERILNPLSWNITSLAGFPKAGSIVLLLAWLSIALFKTGRLCGRLYQIRKVKKAALPAGPELTGRFARLRAELAVLRKADLKLCPVQASPVALGFLHPMILLPEECANSPETPEIEHILRHELAHVRRRDDWANLAQSFIQAALFFHPGVWWISKRLSLEREIACDDYVLRLGAGPRAYALLLADLAGRLKRQDLVLAQGVSSSKSQLQQRINMILNTHRNTSPGLAKARLGFVTASAALIALIALYSAPRVVLAQPPTATPAVPATPAAASIVAIDPAAPAPVVAIVASADEPDSTPAPALAPEVEPGPKFKPSADALPRKPMAPAKVDIGPLPPAAVVIAGEPRPAAVPRPPGTPDAPSANGSLEERIERLEQMVKSLMAQQGAKHPHGALVLRGRGGDQTLEGLIDQKEMEKMTEKINEMAKKQAERAEEQAKRSADMANQQAKHAAEMAERANKDFNFKWKPEAGQHEKAMNQEGFEKQLEALRKAREGLERQMENLDRQIERVERDQERIQQEKERRSELRDEEPKEEEAASVAEAEEN
jgi:beta-lactamase regulating signal transducer with metallopeptidase domain